jgi:hypothetical protein
MRTTVGRVVGFVWGDAIVKLRESEVKLSRSSRLPADHVGQRSPAAGRCGLHHMDHDHVEMRNYSLQTCKP